MSSQPSSGALAPGGAAILRAEGVKKSYRMGEETLQILKGITLEIPRNQVLAIEGPSGAGKSTLLHLLGVLDTPDEGRVLIEGQDVVSLSVKERCRVRNEKIGFVFQFYHLLRDLSALENVCLPAMVRDSISRYDRAKVEARARELLCKVGLEKRLTHRPSQLSGGERQRVAIARALMNEPGLVLCDEPTGNLDQRTAAGILELLFQLQQDSGATFVIVTHSGELAERAHSRIRVVDGVVVSAS